jgi:hemolysin activation/secretion protein
MQSAFAVRGFVYTSQGTRPRAVQLAGSWMLRGYPRYSISGSRVWLANTEWRFPITNYVTLGFPFGAIRFPQIQGAFFADAGQAWIRNDYDQRILGSAGVGFRMALIPGLVLRTDIGRRWSLRGPDGDPNAEAYRRRFVDVFIGYNY